MRRADQVVFPAGGYGNVTGLPFGDWLRSVVKVHLVLADHFGHMAADDDRRRFVQANPQKLRMRGDNLLMSLNRLRWAKCWSMAVPGKNAKPRSYPAAIISSFPERAAAHEVISLNRGAGRAAADDAAAAEHVVKGVDRLRPFVGIDEPPLPAAAEPDSLGLFENIEKLRRLDFRAPVGLQDS